MAKRVLYIEDNASNRKVMRHLFRLTSYDLVEALNGSAGLAEARFQRPDLVLLDLQLPGQSGYEVAQAFRADPDLRTVPIVAVTSFALGGDEGKALDAGCDAYITKPFRPQTILDCLKTYLEE